MASDREQAILDVAQSLGLGQSYVERVTNKQPLGDLTHAVCFAVEAQTARLRLERALETIRDSGMTTTKELIVELAAQPLKGRTPDGN